MTQLRHVKTIVQHVFVLDDGDSLTELPVETHTITAAQWPAYSGERFPRELAETQAKLDVEEAHTITAAQWPAYSGERFPRELAETQAKLDAEEEREEET